MVNNKEPRLDKIFSALSDPTRRAMLTRLRRDELSVADLSQPFDMTKSAITKHVKILENAGLLKRTIDGRVHYCRLEPKTLKQATAWLTFYEAFWDDKFNALEAFLNKEDQ